MLLYVLRRFVVVMYFRDSTSWNGIGMQEWKPKAPPCKYESVCFAYSVEPLNSRVSEICCHGSLRRNDVVIIQNGAIYTKPLHRASASIGVHLKLKHSY